MTPQEIAAELDRRFPTLGTREANPVGDEDFQRFTREVESRRGELPEETIQKIHVIEMNMCAQGHGFAILILRFMKNATEEEWDEFSREMKCTGRENLCHDPPPQ